MPQIGKIKAETASGIVDIPVYSEGDSGSGVYEFLKVQTANGTGFIPLAEPVEANYSYIRVQTESNGVVAIHNESNLSLYIDSFEDGDLAEYSGDTGSYSIVTSRSQEGSYALYNGGNNDSIYSFSGLDNYPSPGDTIQLRTYHGDDEAGSSFGFGWQDTSHGYRAGYHAGQNYWVIYKVKDGHNKIATLSDSSPSSGQWWIWKIEWGVDGKIVFTAESEDGAEIAQISANDSEYGKGGISFTTAHQSGDHDHWWDDVKII